MELLELQGISRNELISQFLLSLQEHTRDFPTYRLLFLTLTQKEGQMECMF